MSFIFGGEPDNHAVNTVPNETLVRITKARWRHPKKGHLAAGDDRILARQRERCDDALSRR
jgi:hypothetical protein